MAALGLLGGEPPLQAADQAALDEGGVDAGPLLQQRLAAWRTPRHPAAPRISRHSAPGRAGSSRPARSTASCRPPSRSCLRRSPAPGAPRRRPAKADEPDHQGHRHPFDVVGVHARDLPIERCGPAAYAGTTDWLTNASISRWQCRGAPRGLFLPRHPRREQVVARPPRMGPPVARWPRRPPGGVARTWALYARSGAGNRAAARRMDALDPVHRCWDDIALRRGCAAPAADAVIEELVRAYREPHRHYHTLDHITALLALLARFGAGTAIATRSPWRSCSMMSSTTRAGRTTRRPAPRLRPSG